jgi:hypothetical protein
MLAPTRKGLKILGAELTVERNSNLVTTRVINPMQANIIRDIRDIVHRMPRIRLDIQRTRTLRPLIGDVIDSLLQCASQDLHDAMGIGMVVDGGPFPGVPDEEELGYWVRLMIAAGYV